MELMLAIAVFIVGVGSVTHLAIRAQLSMNYSTGKSQALMIAREGIEEIRALRNDDYEQIRDFGTSGETISPEDENTVFDRETSVDCQNGACLVDSVVQWDLEGETQEVELQEVMTPWMIPPFPCGKEITDSRDGQNYSTVKIGDDCWIAENINYADHDGGGSFCYEYEEENCDSYGRLYNWDAISDGGEDLCPEGWRAATDDDFTRMERAVCQKTGQSETWCENEFPYGDSEEEVRGDGQVRDYLVDQEYGGTNETDWSGRHGGRYTTEFYGKGSLGQWWTATEEFGGTAWTRELSSASGIPREYYGKDNYYSVRCILDEEQY